MILLYVKKVRWKKYEKNITYKNYINYKVKYFKIYNFIKSDEIKKINNNLLLMIQIVINDNIDIKIKNNTSLKFILYVLINKEKYYKF